MKRTLSIGGATYDLFVRTSHNIVSDCNNQTVFALPLGGKVRVNDVIETCGGGASNTSVGLSRLGCNAAFCGVVGSDQWGEKLLENLRIENVDTRSISILEDEVSSFSIILSASSGERVILYEPGTNAHLTDATFDRAAIQDADWVYLNHIQKESCMIQDDIVTMLAEVEDIHLTWNPGSCQFEQGINHPHIRDLLARTTLLQLNREESEIFSEKTDIKEALKLYLKMGVKKICITLGGDGVIATDGENVYECPILENEAVDTTGAGDAFGTGVTWGLLTDLDLPTALQAGTLNAASVVQSIGAEAGLLDEKAMQDKLSSTSLAINAYSL